MARQVHVTPGGLTSLQAKIGIVVGTMFLLFGLAFGFVALQDIPGSEVGLRLLLGMFFLLWLVACSTMIVFYVRLLKKPKNHGENSFVDFQFEETTESLASAGGTDFEVRLRKLEGLKRDGLISETEYLSKREQILREKW